MPKESDASGAQREKLILALSLLSISLFHLLTIRQGHVWGGDFSMYIRHAINIAEGTSYADTGYIFNPFNPTLAPSATPPAFPLLLAPVYRWFGVDLTAMKVVPIAAFILALIPIFFVVRRELSYAGGLMTILILGFSPFFWDFKDDIRPDSLFLLLTFLTLFVSHHWYSERATHEDRIRPGVGLGLLLYVAYATRSVGVLMPVTLVAFDLIKHRRLQKLTLASVTTFISLAMVQFLMLPSGTYGYADQFDFQWRWILIDLISYSLSLAALWDNGYSQALLTSLFVISTGLAFMGFLRRLKERVSLLEIYTVVYGIGLLIWPTYQGLRYLIPIVPLYIYYAFVSLEHLHSLVDSGAVNRPLLLFTLLIAMSYAGKYSTVNFQEIGEGIGEPRTMELFEYVRENTEEESVFIFAKPRVLALFTGRRAAAFHDEAHLDDGMLSFWEEIGADYVVTREIDPAYWLHWVRQNQHLLQERYDNGELRLYQILTPTAVSEP